MNILNNINFPAVEQEIKRAQRGTPFRTVLDYGWTKEDEERATSEGWYISTIHSAVIRWTMPTGPWGNSSFRKFKTAVEFVEHEANWSDFHKRALAVRAALIIDA